MPNTVLRRSLLIAGAAAVAAPRVLAQSYPSRSVRLVVPFAPGGASDTFARIVAPRLGERLGQPIVVDNRPGAGGKIAADHVAKSAPDGYTLLVADVGPNAIAPGFPTRLPYDPQRDFAPVSYSFNLPIILVVNPAVPAKSVRELVALAKTQPGRLNYASAGPGGISHLAGEMLRVLTGIDIQHIPYKGGAPGIAAVVAGEAQLMFISVPTAQAFIKAGRLRALAMSGRNRSPVFPDVPTMVEAGIARYEADSWGGIMAPAATPPPVVERLASEFTQLLREPDVASKLRTGGFDPVGAGQAEFNRFIVAEIAKWTDVIQRSGARED
jgi:tripartite-type tricarboxylate transporter receptor subunit TctC